MTGPWRLDPTDAAVVARTTAAVEAAAARGAEPTLKILCRRCGKVLAVVGEVVGFGPLFTSSWKEPRTASLAIRGERVTERQLVRLLRASGATVSGYDEPDDRAGAIALLELPTGFTPDYPDLLVRCSDHGELALDRVEVLDQISRADVWRITPKRAQMGR